MFYILFSKEWNRFFWVEGLTEKPFEELLGADLQVRNEKGDLIFSLKRKGEKYGSIYYLFELRWDRMKPEELIKFNIAWKIIKKTAADMGFPLYDIEEIRMKAKEKMKTLKERSANFSVEVLDHATGKTNVLTLGISKEA